MGETKSFDVGASQPSAPISPTPEPSSAPISPTPAPSVSAPNNGVPTFYPTHTPPTMYPTGSVPTDPVPTPYPTDIPLTPFPTAQACTPRGEYCSKHKECCSGECNLKKNICRK